MGQSSGDRLVKKKRKRKGHSRCLPSMRYERTIRMPVFTLKRSALRVDTRLKYKKLVTMPPMTDIVKGKREGSNEVK